MGLMKRLCCKHVKKNSYKYICPKCGKMVTNKDSRPIVFKNKEIWEVGTINLQENGFCVLENALIQVGYRQHISEPDTWVGVGRDIVSIKV